MLLYLGTVFNDSGGAQVCISRVCVSEVQVFGAGGDRPDSRTRQGEVRAASPRLNQTFNKTCLISTLETLIVSNTDRIRLEGAALGLGCPGGGKGFDY